MRLASSLSAIVGVFLAGTACAAVTDTDDPVGATATSRQAFAEAQPTGPSQQAAAASDAAGEIVAPGDASGNPDANPEQLLALYAPNSTAQSATTMDELDFALGQRQIFTDLRTLQDRINDTQRPTINAVARGSSQSDHLDINQAELSQDLFFSEGRTELRLGLQAIEYDPRVGKSISQYVAGLTGHQRINDLAALTGEFWVNQLRSGGDRNVKATYDAFLTLRPSDAIRVDFSTSRRIFDNIRSLQLGLSATSYGGSIDFTPADDLRLTARGNYGSYSDGNRRRAEEIEGILRVNSKPIIEIGMRGTNFHFSKLFDNGYFNPSNYYSGEGMFRLQSSLSEALTLQLAGSAGVEHAEPGGTRPLFKGSLQVAYKVSPRWSLDGELSHFSSRQSTSAGFSRTSATLGLHYRF